jgi:hypothetical protein
VQFTDFITLIVALGSLSLSIIAWKKFKPETRVIDGSAMKNFTELLDRATKREKEYQDEQDALNKRITQLELKTVELAEQVKAANLRAAKFEDWANRLAHQVISLRGIPVPLEVAPQ